MTAPALGEIKAVTPMTEPPNRMLALVLPSDGDLAFATVYYRDDESALEAAAAEVDYDPRDRWFFLGGQDEGPAFAGPSSWTELLARAERLGETVVVLHVRPHGPIPPQPSAEVHEAARQAAAACAHTAGMSGMVHAAVEAAWMYATGARG